MNDVKGACGAPMRRLALVATLVAISLASSARADDWAQPVVDLQQSLAALGVSLGGGVTGFGQGLAGGDGEHDVPFGGKADVLVGLDAGKLGLWPGLSVSAHFEQTFGQSANELRRRRDLARQHGPGLSELWAEPRPTCR